jgi:hypothetical protein
MAETPPPQKTSAGEGLLIGGAVFAMIACCGLPILIAALSSVAIGTVLGVGGGIIAAAALLTLAVIRVRAHRRACAPGTPKRQPAAHSRR